MRDSALKLVGHAGDHRAQRRGRRRAHARQRFETVAGQLEEPKIRFVGEELMRDSALKRRCGSSTRARKSRSEKSSCATAL